MDHKNKMNQKIKNKRHRTELNQREIRTKGTQYHTQVGDTMYR